MSEGANPRRPVKPPEPSQAPLWFIIVGLSVALFSRGMNDENVATVVFWLGVAFSVGAMIYWVARPKHGLR